METMKQGIDYRRIVNLSLDLICIAGMDGSFKYLNPAWESILGYTRDELLPRPFFDFIHPDDHAKDKEEIAKLAVGHLTRDFESRNIHKDGSIRYISWTAQAVGDEIYCIGRDITERKNAEEALRESEHKFKAFFESIPMGAVLTYHSTEPFTVNKAFCEMLGYSKEELETKSSYKTGKAISYPEDQRKESEYIKKMISGDIPNYRMEKRFIKKNGDSLYCDVSTTFVRDDQGEIILGISSILDIEDRKKAEQTLKEAQERYDALSERSFDSVYLHDFEGNYLDGNKAVLDLTGYSKEEIVDLNISHLISGDQLEQAIESTEIILRQGYEEQLRNYKIRTRNNETREVQTRGALIFRNGKPYAIQGICRDITDLKETEKVLKESESKFRSLFEFSPYPIVLTSYATGTIIDTNDKCCDLTGYTKDELIGKTTMELGLYSEEERDWFLGQLQESGRIDGLEMDFRVKEGKIRNCLVSATVVRINDMSCILLMFIDMTDFKHLESQIRQTQKIEAIGTLAGGIAHDFNNILGIILGNAELANLYPQEKDKVQKNIDQIIDACLRGESVVRQLLDFSRRTEQTKLSLTLTPLIKESIKLLRPLIPTNIEFRQTYNDKTSKTQLDPIQLHQVVINLCTNAYQAMFEKGGVIEVSHDAVNIDEKNRYQYKGIKPGGYIRLCVSDTGVGIPPESLDRIFDPYFTTKESTAGTGLGLSVVHGIVEDCNGAIMVSSEMNKRTTFTVLFPVVEEDKKEDEVFVGETLPGGSERVMVIDDEKNLANIGSDMLGILGYQASFSDSALKALGMITADPFGYDLLIIDMAMPKMTGLELAREITKIRSDMPMILSTGHNENMDEVKAKKKGFKAFLMKPVKMQELADTVRKVLDEAKRNC